MTIECVDMVGLLYPLLDGPHLCTHDGKTWEDNSPLLARMDDGTIHHFLFTSVENVHAFLPLAMKTMGIQGEIRVKCVRLNKRAADDLKEMLDKCQLSLSLDPTPDPDLGGATSGELLPHTRGKA